ncbi:unnamed protein product [Notodromas monacha]|uniref:RRM domain-containing protein n=1 Tax=Notodromas monacha TaxID=399045 RepID=A0A7R9BXM2_9CRUS|nr:unnamed protein product [Notodromas monacha]CAG0923670.1 unnamed protein product [Notodromas monacha]
MRFFKTGYSYGYGFVDFQRAEDAARAIETLNGLDVMNKKIKVSYARPPGEHIKDTNLYVAGIPREYNENQFEKLFSEYGQIIQRNILRDKATGASRGVGFVRFDTKDQAEAAIMGLNGTIPMGSTEALKIKIAEDHGKQRAAYNAGWAAGTRRDGTRSGPVAMAGSPDGLAGKFPNPSGMLSSSSSSRGGPGGPPMPGYGGVGAMRNDRPNNRLFLQS